MPSSLNISVGEVAEFQCQIDFTVDHVIWNLNETRIQHYSDIHVQEKVYLSSQPISSTVRISATLASKTLLDNGLVQCEGIYLAENVFKTSLSATLRVQGQFQTVRRTISVHSLWHMLCPCYIRERNLSTQSLHDFRAKYLDIYMVFRCNYAQSLFMNRWSWISKTTIVITDLTSALCYYISVSSMKLDSGE